MNIYQEMKPDGFRMNGKLSELKSIVNNPNILFTGKIL